MYLTLYRNTVPRPFLWMADLVLMGVVFGLAHLITSIWQPHLLLVPDSPAWLTRLSPPQAQGAAPFPTINELKWIYLTVAPASIIFLELLGAYTPYAESSLVRLAAATMMAPLCGLGLNIVAWFATKSSGDWSRLLVFTFTLMSSVALVSSRLLGYFYFQWKRSDGRYRKNLLVVGGRPELGSIACILSQKESQQEYNIVGALCVQEVSSVTDFQIPCLGKVEDIDDILVHQPIEEVVVVLPTDNGGWVSSVIKACDYFRVVLRIIPKSLFEAELNDLEAFAFPKALPFPAVVLQPKHWNSSALFIKRAVDIVISSVLLLVLLPAFLLIALAIKLTTPHLPVFYRWRVVGHHGVRFTGYKFTTMVLDADDRKKDLMHLNEMSGPVFKITNDPRVTPLGKFLRKYSLNELPQLWSVFNGDMSLVGPRPAGPHELVHYQSWQKRKLSIQPGITCLWQVRGRNKISSFDDWVKMDLEYIENWSLWLDFKILLKTAWVVIRGTGS